MLLDVSEAIEALEAYYLEFTLPARALPGTCYNNSKDTGAKSSSQSQPESL